MAQRQSQASFVSERLNMSIPPSDPQPREAVLRERIRELYAVFRSYRLAPDIHSDPCFPGACDDRPLRAYPLHQLPPEAYSSYQWKAMTTWGSVSDFKHFLPRMLDIIATLPSIETEVSFAEGGRFEAWIVFEKLRYGDWRRWTAVERQSLDAYFDALWSVLLVRPLDLGQEPWCIHTLGEWLRAFAFAHDDLTPFLQQWENEAQNPTEGLLAASRLAQTIVRVSEGFLKRDSLGWDCYHELDKQERQVIHWLASDGVFRLLESAYFRWHDSPHASLLSEGHYWLGLWRDRIKAGG